MKFFLLDADYQVIGEKEKKTVVRLFGLCKKKNSWEKCILLDESHEPYIYVLSPEPYESKKKLEEEGAPTEDGELKPKKIDVVQKKVFGEMQDVLKLFFESPRDVPRYRDLVKDFGLESREDDIPFVRRYLIDRRLRPLQVIDVQATPVESDSIIPIFKVSGMEETKENIMPDDIRVMSLDTEVYNPEIKPRPDRDPIIAASFSDSSGFRRVITWKDPGTSHEWLEIVKDEKELLGRIVKTVQDQDPHIVVTYNGDNFDFPYLSERAKRLGVDLKFGWTEDALRFANRGRIEAATFKGRVHVDLYHIVFTIVRRTLSLPHYTLEALAQKVLGIDKQPFAGNIFEAWDHGGEELDKMLVYALEDADATIGLANTYLPLQFEFARFIRSTLFDVSRMSTGQLVETLLLNRASLEDEVAPSRPRYGERAERHSQGAFKGAYVKEPVKGLHENLAIFDFRSLYPSIIITHNIGPSTIDCGCCTDSEAFTAPELGYKFCQKRRGLVPEALGDLFNNRVALKQKMKKIDKESKDYKRMDAEQNAMKLFLNSAYGYMGYMGARWYSRQCAEATTAIARSYIHDVIKQAEDFGFTVLYGDTDSLFVKVDGKAVVDGKKVKEMSKEFLKKINAELPGMMSLELEGYYTRGVLVTKKRYAIIDEEGKIITKGLEVRRRDWSEIAKRTQRQVIKTILEGKPESAFEIVQKVVRDLKGGEVPAEDLVIYTQLIKPIDEYKAEGPHVAAAKRAKAAGRPVDVGSVIGYIVTKPKARGAKISDRAIPVELYKGGYDPEYYVKNQVLPPTMRILEVFGYGEIDFGDQTKLDAFF